MSAYGSLIADLAESGEKRGNAEETLRGAVADLAYRRDRKKMQLLNGKECTNDTLRAIVAGIGDPTALDPRRHPRIR